MAGYRVDLVTYPFGDDVGIPGLRIIRSARPPFLHDVKIGPSIAKLVLDFPLYFCARQLLKKNKYDIIHSHEEAAFFCVGLARKHRLAHIYDMHSSLPHQLKNFNAYNIGVIKSLFDRLEKNVLTTCDGVITICPELAEIAEPLCGATPHAMIENTADDRKVFGITVENVREKYGLESSKIILYTGTFEPYQGLDLLLKAMKEVVEQYPDAQLVMVGGQPDQIRNFEILVQKNKLVNNVTFIGSVHPSKIPGFLESADVIVSPRSSGTNTPLKIYGYMRSGRPLVATDMLTHTQALDTDVAILVPATTDGLAGGINSCLSNPAYARRVADAAKERANELFSDDRYIHKVIQLYRDATERRAVIPSQADAA